MLDVPPPPPALEAPAPVREPAIAAGLAFVTPVAATAALGFGLQGLGLFTYFHPLMAVAATTGMGAGHVYAGDPGRGALVGAGAPLVIGGSAFLGAVLMTAMNPGADRFGMSLAGVLGGTTLAYLGYGGWAAADAYGTAVRMNGMNGMNGSHRVNRSNAPAPREP